MSFLEINLDDVQEPKAQPGGFYNLQITESKLTKTGPNSKKPGSPQYQVSLAFTDEPDAPNITHFISLPNEGDEPKAAQFKALMLKRFLVLFNIPFDNRGIDTERLAMEMVGASANCEVDLTEPDANGNTYNRLKVPKVN